MDWPTAVLGISTAVISAGSALLGSYLAMRSQVKTKSIELQAQSSLKAKELIFSAYQKRLETLEREAKEIKVQIDEFLIKMLNGTFDGTDNLISQFTSRHAMGLYLDEFRGLVEEMKLVGIAEKYQTKIKIIEEFLTSDIRKELLSSPDQSLQEKRENIQAFLSGFAFSISLIPDLHSHLLQKQAENLFSEYVKK